VYPSPAVADTRRTEPTVYIGSKDQSFYALDARTGEVRWQKDVGGIVLGAGSVIGEVAYVGVLGPQNGTLGFDAKTGKKVFEHEFGEYNPVISDGKRLYLTGTSGIRAFEHKTREQRRKAVERKRREQQEAAEKRRRQRKARRAKRQRQRAAHGAKVARQREAHAAKEKREKD
jgi:hypothetical protein